MKLNVLVFAAARDLLGQDEVAVELNDDALVRDLKAELVRMYPEARDIVQRSAISVAQSFATDETPLQEGQEIALIPPVSGG